MRRTALGINQRHYISLRITRIPKNMPVIKALEQSSIFVTVQFHLKPKMLEPWLFCTQAREIYALSQSSIKSIFTRILTMCTKGQVHLSLHLPITFFFAGIFIAFPYFTSKHHFVSRSVAFISSRHKGPLLSHSLVIWTLSRRCAVTLRHVWY